MIELATPQRLRCRRSSGVAGLGAVALLLCAWMACAANGQFVTRDPRFYSREGDFNYKWPNPGDPEYRTYTHNDRRYGYYQPDGYGQQYPGQKHASQYPQGIPLGEDKFKFDPVS